MAKKVARRVGKRRLIGKRKDVTFSKSGKTFYLRYTCPRCGEVFTRGHWPRCVGHTAFVQCEKCGRCQSVKIPNPYIEEFVPFKSAPEIAELRSRLLDPTSTKEAKKDVVMSPVDQTRSIPPEPKNAQKGTTCRWCDRKDEGKLCTSCTAAKETVQNTVRQAQEVMKTLLPMAQDYADASFGINPVRRVKYVIPVENDVILHFFRGESTKVPFEALASIPRRLQERMAPRTNQSVQTEKNK